jgi:hypothetical protein
MTHLLKTPEAARALGATYWKLVSLLRSSKFTPPQKDSSGDYVWDASDLERARAALAIDLRRKEHRVSREGVPA